MIKFFISVTSHALDPPCHKLSHFLGFPPPLERDVLYGPPRKDNLENSKNVLKRIKQFCIYF